MLSGVDEDSVDRLIDMRSASERGVSVRIDVVSAPKKELSIYAKMLYIVLCVQAEIDGNGGGIPTVGRLSLLASCSKRKIFRSLNVLKQRGLLIPVSGSQVSAEGREVSRILCEVRGFENYISPMGMDRR
jgi:hypothetical protein